VDLSLEDFELKKVAILAALDTRGNAAAEIKNRLQEKGCEAIVIDTGVLGKPQVAADVTRDQVAQAGGKSLAEIQRAAGEGAHQAAAIKVMTRGVEKIVPEMYRSGQFQGIMAVGGSFGTAMGLAAMKLLPVGVPKLILTTVMGGQSVDNKDILMMPLFEDEEKVETCLARAAYAIAGMVEAEAVRQDLPMIGITVLGVTTPGVEKAVALLAEKGYDPVVFHARSEILEELIEQDRMKGIFDFTSFETILLGRERLASAGEKALPQVIVPGALDMLIFPGTRDMLSEEHQSRKTHEHGPMIILVRTNRDEMHKAAKDIAERANNARGPVKIIIPYQGFSSVDRRGHEFFDPDTDYVFAETIKSTVKPEVQIIELDYHINDPEFAEKAVDIFHETFQEASKGG
jgi:uncharacterized protein (UPF0261 family)